MNIKGTFELWMEKVNQEIERLTDFSLSHEDLPDRDWHTMWDNDMSAKDAAKQSLSEDGYDFEEDEEIDFENEYLGEDESEEDDLLWLRVEKFI